MVVDATRFSKGCCFDYGNVETTGNDDGAGTMECLYFGSDGSAAGGWAGPGQGNGPWVAADLENGISRATYRAAILRQSYTPKKMQGAITLGTGGDGSNEGTGTFFEGAITSGNPPDAVDDAVQANVVAAGYGK